MNKYILVCVFIAVVLKSNATKTSISGSIGSVEICNLVVFSLSDQHEIDTSWYAMIDSAGIFNTTLDLNSFIRYGRIMFCGHQFEFAISPGDSIVIQMDLRSPEKTLKYSGQGGIRNNYLANLHFKYYLHNGSNQIKMMKDSGKKPYFRYRRKFYKEGKSLLRQYKISLKNSDPRFYDYEKENLKYNYKWDILRYAWVNEFYNNNNDSIRLNRVRVNRAKINSTMHTNSFGYLNFLIEYMNYKSLKTKQNSNYLILDDELNEHYLQRFSNLCTEYLDSTNLTYFHSNILPKMKYLINYHIDSTELYFHSEIYKYATNGKVLLYRDLPNIFDFDDITFVFDTSGQFLPITEILNSNQTELIYLDFWATWCGPCIRSIPYSNRLQNEFKNKEIEFVNICLGKGDELQRWQSVLRNNDWKGSNYFYNNEGHYNTAINNFFKVFGFPTYRIIDKHGYINIIDSPKNCSYQIKAYIDQ